MYEVTMIVLNLTGVSFLKISLTSSLWLSIILILFQLRSSFHYYRCDIPMVARRLIMCLLAIHLVSIISGLFNFNGSATTAIGNKYNILAMFSPLGFIFAVNWKNHIRIIRYLRLIYLPAILLLISWSLIDDYNIRNKILELLTVILAPIAFYMPVLRCFRVRTKQMVYLLGAILFVVSILFGDRTLTMRLLMLIFLMGLMSVKNLRNIRHVGKAGIFLAMLTVAIAINSLHTGESPFNRLQEIEGNGDLSADTRTFLYVEVLDDLLQTESLWFGKGATGTYHSDFFEITGGDTDTRNHVEVGVLSLLLKNGIVGMIVYMIILLLSAFLALFRSKNRFSLGLGFVLLFYFILLFIKYPLSFGLESIILWFLIGTALSKKTRQSNDREMLEFLNT